MTKTFPFFVLSVFVCYSATADTTGLDTALRATYENCVGIDDALYDMKVKAGINTAITGVGTGLGIGATAVGIAKKNTDALLEEKKNNLRNVAYSASGGVQTINKEEFAAMVKDMFESSKKAVDEAIEQEKSANGGEKALETPKEAVKTMTPDEKDVLIQKSKKFGKWRTGLLIGNTATNIASATIAGTNKVDQSLQDQIQNCRLAVKNLQNAILQAKFAGEDISEAVEIESACRDFEYVDITKINERAKGSMVSSIVGTGTGVVGTITSALANSNEIRNDDTVQGKRKEENLNTAANVFSAGSAVASASATVFNAAQIKAIKDVAIVAEKCTGALK